MSVEYWVELTIAGDDVDVPAVTRLSAELAQLVGLDHEVLAVSVRRWVDDDGEGEPELTPVDVGSETL